MLLQQTIDAFFADAFFAKRISYTQPLLLALSGGADSRCLFQLLLEHKKKHPFELIIVHVDHGWRKQSQAECDEVKKQAASFGLSCYTKRLDPTSYTENVEAASRRERMQFFTQVAKNTNAQGLFLAHHADDLAETFFKRMLEGASLYSLYGMSPVSHFDSLVLFRPLLQVTKRQILQYAQEHNISYFDDPTNVDPKFLRARQRTKIFPFLKETFGKSFENNLCRQAHDSYELHLFLDKITKEYFAKECFEHVLHGPWGHLFEALPHDPFLLKFMVKKIALIYGCVLTRDQIESICQNLLEKKANKRSLCGDTTFICDRGRLFVLERKMPQLTQTKKLEIGTERFGPWEVTVSEQQGQPCFFNHWKNAFFGELVTCVPKGDYSLSPLEPRMRRVFLHKDKQKTTKIITNFLNEKKTPHFLTSWVPVLIWDGYIVEDFLTGYRPQGVERDGMLLVKMTFKG